MLLVQGVEELDTVSDIKPHPVSVRLKADRLETAE